MSHEIFSLTLPGLKKTGWKRLKTEYLYRLSIRDHIPRRLQQ
ncbi:hypothetical protein L21SP2_3363 [Salinispira pacifica]|uniref:Uncharacterized protein n=1 Tax=Salinispira pacifica TaxID=1307761 RepID=V5WNR1_9SPIO|nr:hypothetical protein L21SP2_3363 [Salinispira pacifica]